MELTYFDCPHVGRGRGQGDGAGVAAQPAGDDIQAQVLGPSRSSCRAGRYWRPVGQSCIRLGVVDLNLIHLGIWEAEVVFKAAAKSRVLVVGVKPLISSTATLSPPQVACRSFGLASRRLPGKGRRFGIIGRPKSR